MNDVTTILLGLALVLAVATLFIATALARKRAIEEWGYRRIDATGDGVAAAVRTVFGREPVEVYAREERNGESRLALVGPAKNDPADCVVRVRALTRGHWPNVALLRAGGKLADKHRRKTEDFITGLEAMGDADFGVNWVGYRERGRDVSAPLAAWLSGLIGKPRMDRVLGVAVCGPFLIAWADRRHVNSLLAAGKSLSASLSEAPP
jgi:hypothetical protein